MTLTSSELLEQLLISNQISTTEIDDLINNRVREDIYLEYKHGDDLKKPDASNTIREYMSGFANSAGGVLIIGIDAPNGEPVQITGCHGHKRGNLMEWAARCLNQIASYFSPLPRFSVLSHPKGDILIGVTPRSLGLVPETKNGRVIYHFRFQDQTMKAPDYLMADLLLGRRQNPILEISDCRMKSLKRVTDNPSDAMSLEFDLQLQFENQGMVWAEESRWGVIAMVQAIQNVSGYEVNSPSNQLLSLIEVLDTPPNNWPLGKQLLHIHKESHGVRKPFGVEHRKILLTIPLRVHRDWFAYAWKAAAYLISKNSLPIWYQICINIGSEIASMIDTDPSGNGSSEIIALKRLISERPVVAWESFRSQQS